MKTKRDALYERDNKVFLELGIIDAYVEKFGKYPSEKEITRFELDDRFHLIVPSNTGGYGYHYIDGIYYKVMANSGAKIRE